MSTYYQTLTVDDAESTLARGLRRLAAVQATIDGYDADRLPVPADVLADYDAVAERLSVFADAWGFDISDVLSSDGSAMH